MQIKIWILVVAVVVLVVIGYFIGRQMTLKKLDECGCDEKKAATTTSSVAATTGNPTTAVKA